MARLVSRSVKGISGHGRLFDLGFGTAVLARVLIGDEVARVPDCPFLALVTRAVAVAF